MRVTQTQREYLIKCFEGHLRNKRRILENKIAANLTLLISERQSRDYTCASCSSFSQDIFSKTNKIQLVMIRKEGSILRSFLFRSEEWLLLENKFIPIIPPEGYMGVSTAKACQLCASDEWDAVRIDKEEIPKDVMALVREYSAIHAQHYSLANDFRLIVEECNTAAKLHKLFPTMRMHITHATGEEPKGKETNKNTIDKKKVEELNILLFSINEE